MNYTSLIVGVINADVKPYKTTHVVISPLHYARTYVFEMLKKDNMLITGKDSIYYDLTGYNTKIEDKYYDRVISLGEQINCNAKSLIIFLEEDQEVNGENVKKYYIKPNIKITQAIPVQSSENEKNNLLNYISTINLNTLVILYNVNYIIYINYAFSNIITINTPYELTYINNTSIYIRVKIDDMLNYHATMDNLFKLICTVMPLTADVVNIHFAVEF